MGGRILVALGLAALAAGCVNKADTGAAEAATQTFHERLDAKAYAEIYADAAPAFRAATSEPVFAGFMARIDRKLGPCRKPVKTPLWRFNAGTGGTTLAQGYRRACANGELEETVTILVADGQARLLRYDANSPLLLTD